MQGCRERSGRRADKRTEVIGRFAHKRRASPLLWDSGANTATTWAIPSPCLSHALSSSCPRSLHLPRGTLFSPSSAPFSALLPPSLKPDPTLPGSFPKPSGRRPVSGDPVPPLPTTARAVQGCRLLACSVLALHKELQALFRTFKNTYKPNGVSLGLRFLVRKI